MQILSVKNVHPHNTKPVPYVCKYIAVTPGASRRAIPLGI
jgi:hypothetical protein